ncbi:unnamed protein product [Bursaphelenchus okinawaensis]|uniref:Uncharacterized protein n=1 Tax=Bursaphelenchus okinawaensis TaxID=465554 RepID=A0A811LCX4_9BILA|nr:unnamed protein product [Bursaphelenchus okinawaensis]CAG9120439.1 unnamed protein product [Bursaphelenchus okinawaensis]
MPLTHRKRNGLPPKLHESVASEITKKKRKAIEIARKSRETMRMKKMSQRAKMKNLILHRNRRRRFDKLKEVFEFPERATNDFMYVSDHSEPNNDVIWVINQLIEDTISSFGDRVYYEPAEALSDYDDDVHEETEEPNQGKVDGMGSLPKAVMNSWKSDDGDKYKKDKQLYSLYQRFQFPKKSFPNFKSVCVTGIENSVVDTVGFLVDQVVATVGPTLPRRKFERRVLDEKWDIFGEMYPSLKRRQGKKNNNEVKKALAVSNPSKSIHQPGETRNKRKGVGYLNLDEEYFKNTPSRVIPKVRVTKKVEKENSPPPLKKKKYGASNALIDQEFAFPETVIFHPVDETSYSVPRRRGRPRKYGDTEVPTSQKKFSQLYKEIGKALPSKTASDGKNAVNKEARTSVNSKKTKKGSSLNSSRRDDVPTVITIEEDTKTKEKNESLKKINDELQKAYDETKQALEKANHDNELLKNTNKGLETKIKALEKQIKDIRREALIKTRVMLSEAERGSKTVTDRTDVQHRNLKKVQSEGAENLKFILERAEELEKITTKLRGEYVHLRFFPPKKEEKKEDKPDEQGEPGPSTSAASEAPETSTATAQIKNPILNPEGISLQNDEAPPATDDQQPSTSAPQKKPRKKRKQRDPNEPAAYKRTLRPPTPPRLAKHNNRPQKKRIPLLPTDEGISQFNVPQMTSLKTGNVVKSTKDNGLNTSATDTGNGEASETLNSTLNASAVSDVPGISNVTSDTPIILDEGLAIQASGTSNDTVTSGALNVDTITTGVNNGSTNASVTTLTSSEAATTNKSTSVSVFTTTSTPSTSTSTVVIAPKAGPSTSHVTPKSTSKTKTTTSTTKHSSSNTKPSTSTQRPSMSTSMASTSRSSISVSRSSTLASRPSTSSSSRKKDPVMVKTFPKKRYLQMNSGDKTSSQAELRNQIRRMFPNFSDEDMVDLIGESFPNLFNFDS